MQTKEYSDRIKEIALGLSTIVYGNDGAAYHMSSFIEQAEYCLSKVADAFSDGVLVGQEMCNTISPVKLPSDYLIELGYVSNK